MLHLSRQFQLVSPHCPFPSLSWNCRFSMCLSCSMTFQYSQLISLLNKCLIVLIIFQFDIEFCVTKQQFHLQRIRRIIHCPRGSALSRDLKVEDPQESVLRRLGAYPIRRIRLDRRISARERVVSSALDGTEKRQLLATDLANSFSGRSAEGWKKGCRFRPPKSTVYLPAKQQACDTRDRRRDGASSLFLFQSHPFERSLSVGASRASNIPPGQKRSHSHLNLYSHVQHTRDYECVGLMKPGKASAFAPSDSPSSPQSTTLFSSSRADLPGSPHLP